MFFVAVLNIRMITSNLQKILQKLAEAIETLSETQYQKPCLTHSGSTIGQHVRHIIEFFQCLQNGYETGTVNYDLRQRNRLIETNKQVAIDSLYQICQQVDKIDKPILLTVAFEESMDKVIISSTYLREVAYNIEHAIHHMAVIKIGINELSKIELPKDFGVALSTLQYQATCAQ